MSIQLLQKIKECEANCDKLQEVIYNEVKSKLTESAQSMADVLSIMKEIKGNPLFSDIVTDFPEGNPFQVKLVSDMHQDESTETVYTFALPYSVGVLASGLIVKISSSNIMYEYVEYNHLKQLSRDELLQVNSSINAVNQYVKDVVEAIVEIHDDIELKIRRLTSGVSIDDFEKDIEFEDEIVSDECDMENVENDSIEDAIQSDDDVADSDEVFDEDDSSEDDESTDTYYSQVDEEISDDEDDTYDGADAFSGDEDALDVLPDDVDDIQAPDLDDMDSESVDDDNEEMEQVLVEKNVVEPIQKNKVISVRQVGSQTIVMIPVDWVPDLRTNRYVSYHNIVIPVISSSNGETGTVVIDSRSCNLVDDMAELKLNNISHYTVYYNNKEKDNISCEELIKFFNDNMVD